MAAGHHTASELVIALADEADRPAIYRLRHEVYAAELGQHAVQPNGELCDLLDQDNLYIVAKRRGGLIGCISVTPPSAIRFALEKYLSREALPVPRDDSVFEVRLLTVVPAHRGSVLALLLMHAALRYVEEHHGRNILGMGRCEVMPLYQRLGFRASGQTVQSGRVAFAVMMAALADVRVRYRQQSRLLERLSRNVRWELEFPFTRNAGCYHGGRFFKAIGERFDTLTNHGRIINADVLDAWFPPAPAVVETLREHLPWLVRTSPPTQCEGLLATIARVRGVPLDGLVPGAGSSDLIFRAMRHWLNADSRVLILDPMYGEYAHVFEHVIGCRVERFPLEWHNRFEINLEALRRAVRSSRFDLVVLVNPNSPTGQHVDRDALRTFLKQAPTRTRFWIDETYIEYVGSSQSLESCAVRSENIVVCKSMSKVYALSGMRVAYLCGPRPLMEPLREITPPWVVGLPAQVAAVRALEAAAYYAPRYRQTIALRRGLALGLRDLGFEVVEGVANFLLCRLPIDAPASADMVRRCQPHGLFIRDASTMGQRLGDRALRIAVKDRRTNARMIAILRSVLNEWAQPAIIETRQAAPTYI